ncbi:MAG: hypothetical protein ACI9DH_000577 [Halioglobus sp.]|jgi:hypothetical protein
MAKRNNEVSGLLTEWARWRQVNNGADVGYPHQTTFARFMKPTGGANVKPAIIDDEQAERVDRAVSRLKRRCDDGDYRYEVLTDSYLLGKQDHIIGERLKMSRSSVVGIRRAAENFIEGRIDFELCNC